MRPFAIARAVFTILALSLGSLAWRGSISWWWLAGVGAAYVHLLVLGACYIRWNFFLRAMHKGPRGKMQIALTFDDGPAEYSNDVLDVLRREEVPAAFFCIGEKAAAAPQIVHRWEAEGHLTGNHSFHHGFHFDWQSAHNMEAEIRRTGDTIGQITGKHPLLFRPPYGVTNPALAKAVRRSGVQAIGWSLRSYDTKAKSGAALLARLSAQIRDGDIVLLHDSVQLTAGILTAFIRGCREKGFIFVRLDKMLGVDAYA